MAGIAVLSLGCVLTLAAPSTWIAGLVADSVVTPPTATVDAAKTVIAPAPASGSAAVTASGKGEFADLKVTVSQTTDLINQTVTVSWKGGKPTSAAPLLAYDYLQIMQCWGDDLTHGPDRTQCTYGAREAQTNGAGFQIASRQISSGIVDPADPGVDGSKGNVYASFIATDGVETTGIAAGPLGHLQESARGALAGVPGGPGTGRASLARVTAPSHGGGPTALPDHSGG
jgi:hypothetical protein